MIVTTVGGDAGVRTIPRSRTNPQYNLGIPQTLSQFQIGYEHIAELGGLRGKSHDAASIENAFWKNKSFHNYTDYALGEAFHFVFARLRASGHAQKCAVMCAEAVWWRCHRRIIAKSRMEPAEMTAAAVRGPAGLLTYPVFDKNAR